MMSISKLEQRAIRVFVSSTFRDMQGERGELVKYIFPQLRKICEGRGVTWGEVDLRWGITDEQRAEGEVLPICLAEIRGCRPYFIGILGERYGWVPDEIPQELIEQEKWLKEHLEHSVTELEILHGVLNEPKMADHSFFYFRDPTYVDSLRADKQAEFREMPTEEEVKKYGRKEAEKRAEVRKQKLRALKERICKSGLPLRENYRNPNELGHLVLQDLTLVINKLFPESSLPDPLDREAAEHEAFARARRQLEIAPGKKSGVYIRRQEYMDRLTTHVEEERLPLAVLGESGSGKSALLANWAFDYDKRHPDELIIKHFIGSSPQSADWTMMLRRIMGELKRHFNFKQYIPDQPDALKVTFANWLNMAAAKGRVILILDALNQLEDRDGALDLVWLPPKIPANIRLIFSSLPGRPLEEIKRRQWPTLQVEALRLEERLKLIKDYLIQYSKKLSGGQANRIANAIQSSNPLYLRALLEELRVFGIFEELDQRIKHYLSAETVESLYEKVLERYEQDYERDHPGLTGETMSLLWVARRGLSEAELLDMLGTNQEPLPRAYWSPLYLAVEPSLVNRSGMLGLFHEYFRQAVRNRYLSTEEEQRTAHLRLAEYFQTSEQNRRKVDELPWQLAAGKSWQRLYDLLSDLKSFKDIWQANEFDLKEYWAKTENNSTLSIFEAYRSILEAPGIVPDKDSIMDLSRLLKDAGHLTEALVLWTYLAEYFRKIGEEKKLATSLSNQAVLIFKLHGNLHKVMTLHKEEELICRRIGDMEGLQRCLGNQALIQRAQGELSKALVLHREEEAICRKLKDKYQLSICLGNQGLIFFLKKDLEGAIKLFKEQEQINRGLGNKEGLQSVKANQALIQKEEGELDSALALLEEQEQICFSLGNKDCVQESLCNQGAVFYAQGKLDEAQKLFKKMEEISLEIGNKDGLQRSFYNQALIQLSHKEYGLALLLFQKQNKILRELGDMDRLAGFLANQATHLAEHSLWYEALLLGEEAYELVSDSKDNELKKKIKKILDLIRSQMHK